VTLDCSRPPSIGGSARPHHRHRRSSPVSPWSRRTSRSRERAWRSDPATARCSRSRPGTTSGMSRERS